MEFLDLLISKNVKLEKTYKSFSEKRHEEERQHGIEVPILQPDEGGEDKAGEGKCGEDKAKGA